MKKGVIIFILAVIVLVVIGFFLLPKGNETQKTVDSGTNLNNVQTNAGSENSVQPSRGAANGGGTSSGEVTVEMSSSGFSPSSLSINKGDTVTFVNKGTSRWPASNVHPSHTAYPQGGGCIGSAFDACKSISTGSSYSFIFDEVGTWKYHDHLNPSKTGTIIVS